LVRYLRIGKIKFILSVVSNYQKNQKMKAVIKKFATLNKNTIVRSLFFSFLFIIFFVVVLYVLINSPA
jgi:hypothetical protein